MLCLYTKGINALLPAVRCVYGCGRNLFPKSILYIADIFIVVLHQIFCVDFNLCPNRSTVTSAWEEAQKFHSFSQKLNIFFFFVYFLLAIRTNYIQYIYNYQFYEPMGCHMLWLEGDDYPAMLPRNEAFIVLVDHMASFAWAFLGFLQLLSCWLIGWRGTVIFTKIVKRRLTE